MQEASLLITSNQGGLVLKPRADAVAMGFVAAAVEPAQEGQTTKVAKPHIAALMGIFQSNPFAGPPQTAAEVHTNTRHHTAYEVIEHIIIGAIEGITW